MSGRMAALPLGQSNGAVSFENHLAEQVAQRVELALN
jgi:hypothetical protein